MVAAKVRGSRQRADKHGQMPRELADLVLAPDSTFTLHIISHSLSLLMQARQVSLVTGTAGTAATFWDTHVGHTAGRVRDTRAAAVRADCPPDGWTRPECTSTPGIVAALIADPRTETRSPKRSPGPLADPNNTASATETPWISKPPMAARR
jgi:hypothetical protein